MAMGSLSPTPTFAFGYDDLLYMAKRLCPASSGNNSGIDFSFEKYSFFGFKMAYLGLYIGKCAGLGVGHLCHSGRMLVYLD